MSRCVHPLYALDLGVKENGKRNIKILPRRYDLSSYQQLCSRYGEKNVIALPCGSCLNCKLNKAKEWSVRCVLEASLYDYNYFVTLTYSDDNVPQRLQRKHLQSFIKKLRLAVPGCRYFGCGERGSHTFRPHYHLILFNCNLPDFRAVRKNPLGGYIYSSETIKKCWPYGFVEIGEVSYSSCSYVARYATKKAFGNSFDDEFICMSLKPGIGAKWFEKNVDIFDDDAIYGRFGGSKAVKIPRYFEKMFELIDPDKLLKIKDARVNKSHPITLNELLVHSMEKIEDLYSYQDDLAKAKYKRMKEREDL